MALRLTQCHQNWLTMMAGSANFDDAERAEVNNMFYPKPEINLNVRAL